jgi:hypothetical protein
MSELEKKQGLPRIQLGDIDILVMDLNNPVILAEVEATLSEMFPNLDLSTDPAEEMLHGKYGKELDNVIKDLIDSE